MTIQIYQPGDMIEEQYRVEQRVQGGMGYVYICQDCVTLKRFAIKGLRPDIAEDGTSRADQLARFEREATTWLHLGHHPSIVQALAYWRRGGDPLLLLEYMDGPTLAGVLQRVGWLLPGQAVRWARLFCQGMHHAHTCPLPGGQVGTLHRDIKPGNLLLNSAGNLKITDFGLAKLNDGRVKTVTGQFIGTLKYSSPEQLRSAKHVTGASEVFSFGIVLYEMLTGRHPFARSEDVTDVIQSIHYREPSWDGFPPSLLPVTKQCLHKSPAHRFSNFAALRAVLDAIDPRELMLPTSCPACGFAGQLLTTCPVCAANRDGQPREAMTDMPSTIVRDPAVDEGTNSASQQCARCGLQTSPNDVYCRVCGKELATG